jgi:hypothetical protein
MGEAMLFLPVSLTGAAVDDVTGPEDVTDGFGGE